MSYTITNINASIHSDPAAFVKNSDLAFHKKVEQAATVIMEHCQHSHIILLSGPSGSGKTTTAMKIEEMLDHKGIETHTISMDNYFRSIDPETAPRNLQGDIDYESPFCLDMELLNRHFAMLDRGELIHVPKFEFARQMRSAVNFRPLRLEKNDLALFEGIHALNDVITGKNPNAMKLYIAAGADILNEDGTVLFDHTWIRLCRRIVRDAKFRGSDAAFTLKLWPGVCRGERLYISPYRDSANLKFETALPYEVSVLKPYIVPLLEELPGELKTGVVADILRAYEKIDPMDEKYIANNSLIREFIGGSTYQY